MSYQVLARKWRPRSFSTLVGQEHVVRALTHALNEQRLHHAYLFTGTRGVGKTTLARILAKSLNCEAGVSATPCGVCSACCEIDAGRFVDILEVDAATNTRVEEMRQLLESAIYAPTRGRFKVYVIDEVHMLTNSAFNAMLKTLEEPPEHVKFILATTDPQKIPVTVLSRCLQFNLKQMPPTAIVQHLSRILDAEALIYELPALHMLAHAAAGSMRDALSLLDQAIAHGAGRVETTQVRDMLGTVDSDYLFALLDALIAADMTALLHLAEEMNGRSLSFTNALQELARLLVNLQVLQCAPAALPDLPGRERLDGFAAAFTPEFVQLAYQIVVQGRQDMALAPDEYAGFLMTLLRLHTFRPETEGSLPAAGSTPPRKENAAATIMRVAGQAFVPAAGNHQSSPVALLPVRSVPASADAALPPLPVVAVAADESADVPQEPALPVLAVTTALPVSAAPVVAPPDWSVLLGRLELGGLAKTLAQHCELRQMDAQYCLLRLAPEHKHLLMRGAQDKLQQALAALPGHAALRLKIEVAEPEELTPAASAARQRAVAQDAAVAAIHDDPFVQELGERFGATVIPNSIKPIA